MRRSTTAAVASLLAALLAVYEALAITLNVGPTITEIVESWPETIEFAVLGALMVWLAWHFGWLARLFQLFEAVEEQSSSGGTGGTEEEVT